MSLQTFPLGPWFSIDVTDVGCKTDISEGFGGKEWTDLVVDQTRLQFSFPLSTIPTADLASFVSFMQARKGASGSFNFVCPGPWNSFSSTPYVVRNNGDSISWSWVKQNYSTAKVVFIEVK